MQFLIVAELWYRIVLKLEVSRLYLQLLLQHALLSERIVITELPSIGQLLILDWIATDLLAYVIFNVVILNLFK